jgi:hypothetical protein
MEDLVPATTATSPAALSIVPDMNDMATTP